MILSNKYNVPQQTIDKMVKDGIISTSWPMYEEVYKIYLSIKSTGLSRGEIYMEVADRARISEATAKHIILKMDKI
jgi:hypothetical protein